MVSDHPGEFASNRYFDRALDIEAVKLLPGEYHVTAEDIVQVTVLGSCVSACIRDRDRGVGGMNHFMLPDGAEGTIGNSSRYGVNAMEVLINELGKLGARRESLEAKVFGGGSVLRGFTVSNVGQRNAEFVIEFLRTERIPIAARDLEDIYPRKLYYFPRTGCARVKKLMTMHNRTILDREMGYREQLVRVEQQGGEIELFG